MTLCPIAIAVGCKKCLVFKVCPVKGLIGDYEKPTETKQHAQNSKGGAKKQPRK